MSSSPAKVLSAAFRATAVTPDGWPPEDTLEIAFAGRSNVGKSSMINALLGRRNLVRVSNTPGRTRALNFFDVALEDSSGARRSVRLCDLPGYGYAKVAKAERSRWKQMVETYFVRRRSLGHVVAIVDAEVGPTDLDAELCAWLASKGRVPVAVATKLDRLGPAKRKPALANAARALGLPAGSVLGFSAPERLGVAELWARLLGTPATAADADESGTTGRTEVEP